MIVFLKPSQNKHSINYSSFRHKTKAHFISNHCFTKPFTTPFLPPSLHAQEISQFCNNCGSWCYPSTWQFGPLYIGPKQLALKIHPEHWDNSAINWVPTFSLAAINSNDTSGNPEALSIVIPVAPHLYIHIQLDLLLHLHSHHDPNHFFHSWLFPYCLSKLYLFHLTETQLSITSSQTSAIKFFTINFLSSY